MSKQTAHVHLYVNCVTKATNYAHLTHFAENSRKVERMPLSNKLTMGSAAAAHISLLPNGQAY